MEITHVQCQVDRTGEMELEIDGRGGMYHFEISTTLSCSFEGTRRSSERKGRAKKVGVERVFVGRYKGRLTLGAIIRLHASYYHPT